MMVKFMKKLEDILFNNKQNLKKIYMIFPLSKHN